ncbi:uncharacterized protein LOC122380867 isoform X1 [Amphibalanus amphitrite]|uniref:uncharacterized protein LOC122380867 isoform X1 n=1 Tax=Amphibalanus amphitrite TaxID=1232801 RepID=UPI001C914F55|nr:uncharacterized protein LOC122380867 isoform X1 [Amphibalanus amphitrite]
MDVHRPPLLVICVALFGAAAVQGAGYSTPRAAALDQQQTEVSPVRLEITVPVAADQLVRLAAGSSPDVWRAVLEQTPDAARRSLLAQLRARRRSQSGDPHRARSQRSRHRGHRQRARGGGLAARLSSYPGIAADTSSRRSYSTLERHSDGRRRVSSGSSRPEAQSTHQWSAGYREDTDTPSGTAPSPGGHHTGGAHQAAGPADHWGSPAATTYRPGLPQVTSYRPRAPEVTSYRPRAPEVTTYRPRSPEVTTYRPRTPEVTTYRPEGSGGRRARAKLTTFGPAQTDPLGVSSAGYGPPRPGAAPGHSAEREWDRSSGPSRERTQDSGPSWDRDWDSGPSWDQKDHYEEGLEWLKDVVPGVPGDDYPILAEIPETDFSCAGRPQGYFSDVLARCQVYHVCHGTFQKSSFICPNGTVFSQPLATCDWWFNTECSDGLPLPSSTFRVGAPTTSTFRVSRQVSQHMFEHDWVDDYEDSDVTDSDVISHDVTDPDRSSGARGGPGALHNTPRTAQHRATDRVPVPADRSAPSGDRSAPSGGDRSAPSGGDRSASGGDRSPPANGVTWRSPFAGQPLSGSTEAYRRPERHLAAVAAPPEERPGTVTAARHERGETSVKQGRDGAGAGADASTGAGAGAPPFVVRVSYGGGGGRTTSELQFGPRAARSFLSRAQLRGWSFPSGGSAGTEPARGPVTQTARVARHLAEAGRPRTGAGRRLQAGGVSPRPSPDHRPPSTRRSVVQPAPGGPETRVHPPTDARAGPAAERRAGQREERDGSVHWGTTIPSVAQEETPPEEAPRHRRRGGREQFHNSPTDVTSSTTGRSERLADGPAEYDDLLSSASFRSFGLRIPSGPSPEDRHHRTV